MYTRPLIQDHSKPISFGLWGSLPPSVWLHRNQYWSRATIDAGGYTPWIIAFARNKFERLEKVFDVIVWWTLGVSTPLILEKTVSPKISRAIWKKFIQDKPPIDKKISLLKMPLEWLYSHDIGKRMSQLEKDPIAVKRLAETGLSSFQQLVNPKLLRAVRLGKLGIIFFDLFMAATAGQACVWGKNILTKKLSGEKGFSGIFNEASSQYREKKAKVYERQKKWRAILALAIGYASTIVLPLAIGGILKSPSKIGKGIMGKLKKLIPHFNYVDAVYPGKAILFWSVLFNYNLGSLLASRDTNELRETVSKMASLDFFYIVGDAIAAAIGAKLLTRFLGPKLKNVKLFKEKPLGKQGRWKMPVAVNLEEIYKTVGGDVKHQAYKTARVNAWLSLAATTLGLGIATPLLNIWYTRKKVQKEQAELFPQIGLAPLPRLNFSTPYRLPVV